MTIFALLLYLESKYNYIVTLDEGSSAINLILNLPGSVNISYGTHVAELRADA